MTEEKRGWDGDERRSIPIHILTHVSEVMDKMREEEQQRHERLEQRIDKLMESVEVYVEKAQEVYDAFSDAFPRDKKGKPDFVGHANAHEEMKANWSRYDRIYEYVENQMNGDQKREEDKRFVMRAVLVAIVSGLVIWAGSSLWQDAVVSAVIKAQGVK